MPLNTLASWCLSVIIHSKIHANPSIIDYQQFRTRRISQTPYLARTGTITPQVATAMAQQQNTDNASGKDKKSSEPLFGPSIGPVRSGPAWTICSEKKVVTDELTPEVVNSWIEKSKEVSFLLNTSLSEFVTTFNLLLSSCEPSVARFIYSLVFKFYVSFHYMF